MANYKLNVPALMRLGMARPDIEALTYSLSKSFVVEGATPDNDSNAVVMRDESGNFSAGTITANLNGTAANANELGELPASGYATKSYVSGQGYVTALTAPVRSVAGQMGDVVLDRSDVGLGNVDNTSDANKPISTATQTALNAKADASNAVYVLAQRAVASSVTGTLTETTLATITIPANAMGVNGAIRITPLFSYTNSANTKRLRIKFAGNEYWNLPVTTTASSQSITMIRNRNAANSQVGMALAVNSGLSQATTAVVTSAVDTTTDQPLTITAQLANTGETITLEAYTVEILKSN